MARTSRHMIEDILKCKSWGHSWDQYPGSPLDRPRYGVREMLRCTRCGTERHTVYSPITGERYGNYVYIYPASYKNLEKGVSRRQWKADALSAGIGVPRPIVRRKSA